MLSIPQLYLIAVKGWVAHKVAQGLVKVALTQVHATSAPLEHVPTLVVIVVTVVRAGNGSSDKHNWTPCMARCQMCMQGIPLIHARMPVM